MSIVKMSLFFAGKIEIAENFQCVVSIFDV